MKTFKELFEKKLTPAELKKREEIAKAMERENPGMDMSKKMAIATAAAKRVAEDVDEAYMSSDRSKQMFKRKELDHELRHEVEPKRSEPADPHAVHINGKKWKTFPTKSHATNVAKKIAGATVVKESIDEGKIPEMRYSEVMKKIKSGTHEATHDVKPGKHVELRHIDSGKKTTVYVKESSELDEATDYHDQAQEHKKKSDKAMDKNDMEAYHHHMSNYHEALGQWEESKGRSSNAQKHYDKAEGHHELSLKKSNQKNEGIDMLSFKYFQELLDEAKKKCKESSSEIELAHGEMLDKEEDDEDEMRVKESIDTVEKDKKGEMKSWKHEGDWETSNKKNLRGKVTNTTGKALKKTIDMAKKANEEVEIDEQAPVAPVPGMKDGKYAIMVHPESKQRVTIPRKNVKNYPASEGWKEVAPGMKESVEELDEAITHVIAKKDLAAHKEWMDSEGFDTKTKPLPKSHPKHATHVGIVSKNSQESSYHEDGNAVSESVELDEGDELNMRHKFVFNKTAAGKAREVARNREELKMQMKKTKEMGGITGPKGKLPEEVELDEISTATMSHQGKTTLKHVKNPGVQLRMAAHDIKPGIKGYRDRVALMKAADAEKKLKEEVELDEVSPFDWKAYAKEKGTASSNKTKTFHDVKKTSTGTVYTKQVNPDGTSKGSGDDAAKTAEKADAPKRGRGRPAGVGAKTGSYKPRDPAAKAASAAKAAASKAANRAARNEEFDNEFMGSLIEGFEAEDFDEFLYCEEFDELDEATQEALINFINEKSCGSYKMKESLTGKQHKLDKNKNGKIDSHDFKLLRKEETEQVQESVDKYAAFLTKKQ
jgi:hypothetical protein